MTQEETTDTIQQKKKGIKNVKSSFAGFKNIFANQCFFDGVSSEYLKNKLSKLDYLHPATPTNIKNPTGLVNQLGFFKYAQNIDRRLYAGAYLATLNSTSRTKIIQNPHYWNKK
jgi:hypothetical protein